MRRIDGAWVVDYGWLGWYIILVVCALIALGVAWSRRKR